MGRLCELFLAKVWGSLIRGNSTVQRWRGGGRGAGLVNVAHQRKV